VKIPCTTCTEAQSHCVQNFRPLSAFHFINSPMLFLSTLSPSTFDVAICSHSLLPARTFSDINPSISPHPLIHPQRFSCLSQLKSLIPILQVLIEGVLSSSAQDQAISKPSDVQKPPEASPALMVSTLMASSREELRDFNRKHLIGYAFFESRAIFQCSSTDVILFPAHSMKPSP
jgi:hypothetical protein